VATHVAGAMLVKEVLRCYVTLQVVQWMSWTKKCLLFSIQRHQWCQFNGAGGQMHITTAFRAGIWPVTWLCIGWCPWTFWQLECVQQMGPASAQTSTRSTALPSQWLTSSTVKLKAMAFCCALSWLWDLNAPLHSGYEDEFHDSAAFRIACRVGLQTTTSLETVMATHFGMFVI
jgi:hypothetical protein